jgi:hypothetical protein
MNCRRNSKELKRIVEEIQKNWRKELKNCRKLLRIDEKE